METHYLIDYENDGKNGLKGCEKLTISDFIHLFYTDNSKNTTLDIFTNHGKAELDIKKVPAGDQSLDKQNIRCKAVPYQATTGRWKKIQLYPHHTGSS